MEQTIARLNEEKYHLAQLLQRLHDSLAEDKIVFRPSEAEALFREAGVILGDQIKRDYSQLIKFNRAITQERRSALGEQIDSVSSRMNAIDPELRELNAQRAKSLEFLKESESLAKYKELSRELTNLHAELNSLEAKRSAASRFIELRREQRNLTDEYGHLQTFVEARIEELSRDDNSLFGSLRRYFTEIIHEVLGQDAILAMSLNSAGGLEFTAEFVGESGTATSGDRGTTYKKLLCIAFDLAMLRTYIDVPFPRFVYHDGALEQLEPRKRQKLLGVFREYASYGLQPIISVLDSDLPDPIDTASTSATSEEIVLHLHDEGAAGRLFRMPSW